MILEQVFESNEELPPTMIAAYIRMINENRSKRNNSSTHIFDIAVYESLVSQSNSEMTERLLDGVFKNDRQR